MYKVILDPGHGGGNDPGAINKYIKEKDLNLKVAYACKRYLERYNSIEVIMTRYQDTAVALDTRCYISNKEQANLFVSIHNNASGSDAEGYEVYNYTGSKAGNKIANLIAGEFDKLGQKKRYVGSGLYAGSKKGDYYVLSHTDTIACLTEFGFLDSEDYIKMDEAHEITAIGVAHAKGILKYFDIPIQEEVIKETVSNKYATVESVDKLRKALEDIRNCLNEHFDIKK